MPGIVQLEYRDRAERSPGNGQQRDEREGDAFKQACTDADLLWRGRESRLGLRSIVHDISFQPVSVMEAEVIRPLSTVKLPLKYWVGSSTLQFSTADSLTYTVSPDSLISVSV